MVEVAPMEWLIWLLFFVTIISLSGMVLGYIGGRRKFKLELKKEERRLVEAQTKQIQAKNKQVELEYREAVLEVERFDRRSADAGPERAVEPATREVTRPDHP
jgi:hypothetical protein